MDSSRVFGLRPEGLGDSRDASAPRRGVRGTCALHGAGGSCTAVVHGFTLIELLVVVAIVVGLVAILLPVVHRARKQVRTVVCQSTLRQWGLMFKMYTDDNNDKFFTYVLSPTSGWGEAMEPYYSADHGVLFCPEATQGRFDERDILWHGGRYSAWGLRPSNLFKPPFRLCSYGLNQWVMDVKEEQEPDAKAFWNTPLVEAPGRVPVFTDCGCMGRWPEDGDVPPPDLDHWLQTSHLSCYCIDRHSEAINVVFMDWSVRKVGLKGLWMLKWSRQFEVAGVWTTHGGVRRDDWPEWMRTFREY